MPAKPSKTEALIDRAFSKRLEIAALKAKLAEDEAEIVALGAGKHSGALDGHELTVVGAYDGKPGAVYYDLPDDGEAEARELAGDKFPLLFFSLTTRHPIEGFEHVVPTHLPPAKARKLIALCRAQRKDTPAKTAYILWPKDK